MRRAACSLAMLLLLLACASCSVDEGASWETVAWGDAPWAGLPSSSESELVLVGVGGTDPAAVTAREAFVAFLLVGLPAPDPRDRSGDCRWRGCAEQLATDAASISAWPDEDSARRQDDPPSATTSAYPVGAVLLEFGPPDTSACRTSRGAATRMLQVADVCHPRQPKGARRE